MKENLKAFQGDYNLKDYESERNSFQWTMAEKNFSWSEGTKGKVNMAYEAIDKHVQNGNGHKTALIYKDDHSEKRYSYADLMKESNKTANLLRLKAGIQKGDRVFVFMPRSPELYFSVLGILKLGAIAGPLFEAFMEDAVKDRLEDSKAKAIITTPELIGRIPINDLPDLQYMIVVGDSIQETPYLIDYRKHMAFMSGEFELEWVDFEDGLILHYTSGSTGKPKGVLHAHRAMIQHYQTAKWVLDLHEDDIYWCTADPGWVTGTSYGIFAPWLCGVTNVIVGGRFNPESWYDTLDRFGVTVWYSAPTAFRMLMGAGDKLVEKYDLTKLRHIASVGEPLNPEVIKWGMKVFGKRIHDTWWMTETGAQMICNYPSMDIRLGSMGKPIPGIEAAIVDDRGEVLPPNRMGNLAIKKSWPSIMREIWGNPEKYQSYFLRDTWYVSGDSAYMDEDGYFWFQGRIDDVIMTSGERVGPFEVESKLIEHPAVAEAGVIGKPDPVRGEIIKAFIALRRGYEPTDELMAEIKTFVKTGLGAHAAPREIEFVAKLPKTRSGKIMRRVLKAWELKLHAGDLSTMEE